MRLSLSSQRSDYIGAISSTLCMIHCIATPFIFIVSACSASCCATTPLWWQWIDYVFLIISFSAVIQSSKKTKNNFIKYALWTSWVGLLLAILNVQLQLILVNDSIKFVPALSLIGFHLYNYRSCKNNTKECC